MTIFLLSSILFLNDHKTLLKQKCFFFNGYDDNDDGDELVCLFLFWKGNTGEKFIAYKVYTLPPASLYKNKEDTFIERSKNFVLRRKVILYVFLYLAIKRFI